MELVYKVCRVSTQRAFLIRHRNGVEVSTSKTVEKRKNISTSNRRRHFDVEIAVEISTSILRRRNILSFFNAFST